MVERQPHRHAGAAGTLHGRRSAGWPGSPSSRPPPRRVLVLAVAGVRGSVGLLLVGAAGMAVGLAGAWWFLTHRGRAALAGRGGRGRSARWRSRCCTRGRG